MRVGATALVPCLGADHRGQRVADQVVQLQRLDQVAAQLFDEYSRSRLSAWIKDGRLTVDGAVIRPRDIVHSGAVLSLEAEQEAGRLAELRRAETLGQLVRGFEGQVGEMVGMLSAASTELERSSTSTTGSW